MDYSLRELECFSAVAEELSFTRAARRLHLAQPPLSRHIRTLEEKLGCRLFDREARHVSLTVAGNLFYEETRGILPQLVRAGESVKRAARGEVLRLRLGFVSAVLNAELVEALRLFRETHSSIQVLLHDLPPAEQLQRIVQGKLDGGFVGLEPEDHPHGNGIQFTAWRQERLMAFLPSGHALSGRRQLALADLASERLVAVSNTAAPAFAVLVHNLCQQAGFRPRIILESPRAQAVAVMVAAGSGIALLPEALTQVVGSAAVTVPLKEAPLITHVFAFAHGSERAQKPIQHLLALLNETSQNHTNTAKRNRVMSKSSSKAPWNKPAPKETQATKLTPESKAKAKAAAKKAGRKYPNLVDNMNAAREQREAEDGEKRSTKKKGQKE